MIESIETAISSLTFYDYRYLSILLIGFLMIMFLCMKTLIYFITDTWIILIIGDVLAYIHIKLTGCLFGKHIEKVILDSYSSKVAFVFLVTLILCNILNKTKLLEGE